MMFWHSGWSLWQVSVMWVGMLVFWGLLGWGIYLLVTLPRVPRVRRVRDATTVEDARAILDARFARGGIDAETYQQTRALMADRQDPVPTQAVRRDSQSGGMRLNDLKADEGGNDRSSAG